MIRTRDLTNGAIVALVALAGAFYAPELPGEMAIHFDAAGEPDNYMQKEVVLVGSVVLAAVIAALFAVLPRIDPLGENVAEFQAAYDASAVATIAFLAYSHGLVLAYNLGVEFGIVQAMVPATAALYLLLAVLLWRAEQNWFVGIRTPWTLSDERVWNRTHRHTAPLFAVSGLVALGGVVFPEHAGILLSVPVLVVALGSTVYSFVLYQQLDRA